MAPGASNKKVTNGLVALSSAAIVVIYSAGFMKTRAAAAKLDEASNDRDRRPPMPAPPTAGERQTPDRIEPPVSMARTETGVTSPVMPKVEPTQIDAARPTAGHVADAVGSTMANKAVSESAHAMPPAATESAPAHTTTAALETATGLSAKAEEKIAEKAAADLLMPKEHLKDGVYLGWGTCRHGDIQASVTVENGRITASSIAQCWTRYSCSWVSHLPPQVVGRQGPEVDYVSGATQSSNAFYWAVTDALTKAKAGTDTRSEYRRHLPK